MNSKELKNLNDDLKECFLNEKEAIMIGYRFTEYIPEKVAEKGSFESLRDIFLQLMVIQSSRHATSSSASRPIQHLCLGLSHSDHEACRLSLCLAW